jgi:hypothetical protein
VTDKAKVVVGAEAREFLSCEEEQAEAKTNEIMIRGIIFILFMNQLSLLPPVPE